MESVHAKFELVDHDSIGCTRSFENKKLFPILKLSIAYLMNEMYIAGYSKPVHWNWRVPIQIYAWIDAVSYHRETTAKFISIQIKISI
ncbi:MAG TPA: hypothetical protein VE226_04515 [Nitrososphaeraceae archaeon]|nr:hypothetical protein [Nitrososphaeraceae archaeon]